MRRNRNGEEMVMRWYEVFSMWQINWIQKFSERQESCGTAGSLK